MVKRTQSKLVDTNIFLDSNTNANNRGQRGEEATQHGGRGGTDEEDKDGNTRRKMAYIEKAKLMRE